MLGLPEKFLSKDGFLSGTINSWKEFAYIITLTACLGKTLNLDYNALLFLTRISFISIWRSKFGKVRSQTDNWKKRLNLSVQSFVSSLIVVQFLSLNCEPF